MNPEIKCESGWGKDSQLPPELKKWNWGAFLLSWVWGLGNSTYIAFLMFVPFVNIVMPFVLGAKGNKWAWQKRTWRDVDHFRKTQKKWAIAGLLFWIILIPALFFPITGLLKNNDAYKQSLVNLQDNPEIEKFIGYPLKPGLFVTGSISTSGPTGQAALQYSIHGTHGEGKCFVFAYKAMEKWTINDQAVVIENSNKKIWIINSSNQ